MKKVVTNLIRLTRGFTRSRMRTMASACIPPSVYHCTVCTTVQIDLTESHPHTCSHVEHSRDYDDATKQPDLNFSLTLSLSHIGIVQLWIVVLYRKVCSLIQTHRHVSDRLHRFTRGYGVLVWDCRVSELHNTVAEIKLGWAALHVRNTSPFGTQL